MVSACVRAWTLAGFACVDGMGAVCGGPRVDVEVEPRSTFAFGRGFSRVVSVLFARVGPVGVCVRARVGVCAAVEVRLKSQIFLAKLFLAKLFL